MADAIVLPSVRASPMPQGLGKNLYAELSVFENLDFFGQLFAQSVAERRARDGSGSCSSSCHGKMYITIFISTHFMNEAMRCDRISLMHAGTVLVADTPAALVQRARSGSLEDAFIGYLDEAIAATAWEPPATAGSQLPELPSPREPRSTSVVRACGLQRLLAYSASETLEALRDPIRLAFAFLGSVVLMLLMGFGITMDVEDLRYAAPRSRPDAGKPHLPPGFAGSPRFFIEQPPLRSPEELLERLQANDISFCDRGAA